MANKKALKHEMKKQSGEPIAFSFLRQNDVVTLFQLPQNSYFSFFFFFSILSNLV